jgi:hypothetical protein
MNEKESAYYSIAKDQTYEGKKVSDMKRKDLLIFVGFLHIHLTGLTTRYYELTGKSPWQADAVEPEKSAIILPDHKIQV